MKVGSYDRLVTLQEEIPESLFSLSPLTIWEHSEKVAIYKPERELLSETDHAGTLIGCPTSKLWENRFL